jgi:hypothetical protein
MENWSRLTSISDKPVGAASNHLVKPPRRTGNSPPRDDLNLRSRAGNFDGSGQDPEELPFPVDKNTSPLFCRDGVGCKSTPPP